MDCTNNLLLSHKSPFIIVVERQEQRFLLLILTYLLLYNIFIQEQYTIVVTFIRLQDNNFTISIQLCIYSSSVYRNLSGWIQTAAIAPSVLYIFTIHITCFWVAKPLTPFFTSLDYPPPLS